ncbi:MAG: tyrosine-type recombinase/integrase [Marmoricola sp.]
MLPKISKVKEHRYLTHEQVARLADEIDEEFRTLILIMAYCGLRWGEVTALRVRDIDVLRGRLTVARGAVELPDGIAYDSPKSHAQRTLVIPASLRPGVEAHMSGKSPDSLLFTSPEGGPLRASNFRQRSFAPAVKRAGLGITPHDLRHTAASLAIASGANVKAVQRMLGQQSAAMTLDTYSGLFDSDLEAVADGLDKGIAAAAADYLRTSSQITPLQTGSDQTAKAL